MLCFVVVEMIFRFSVSFSSNELWETWPSVSTSIEGTVIGLINLENAV